MCRSRGILEKLKATLSQALQDAGIAIIDRIAAGIHAARLGSVQHAGLMPSPKARKRHGKGTAKGGINAENWERQSMARALWACRHIGTALYWAERKSAAKSTAPVTRDSMPPRLLAAVVVKHLRDRMKG